MGQILFVILMLAFVFMSVRWLWLQSVPATDVLTPRWTTTRRFYTNREHDQWDAAFEAQQELSKASPGRGSTRE